MEDFIVKVKKEKFTQTSNGKFDPNPNFFLVITQEVDTDERLSSGEVRLYGFISSLCHAKGYCWASNELFENRYKKSKATICRFLANLKECGYIFCEYIIDEDNGKQLERRIYPIINIEFLRKLAHNSMIGLKNETTPGLKNETTPGLKNETTPGLKNETI